MKYFTKVSMCLAVIVALCLASGAASKDAGGRLFPEGLTELTWLQFKSDGFSKPVSGLVFRTDKPACCGVTLGGIGTGSLDINTDGVLGFCTYFPAPVHEFSGMLNWYRNQQMLLPFLGMSVGGKTWVLSTRKYLDGGIIQGCTEPGNALSNKMKENPEWLVKWQANVPKTEGVSPVEDIDYFGHFPVADVEYKTDASVGIAMRAWSPFIPGDAEDSNIPGNVFELRLRNTMDSPQDGTIGFSFPGPFKTKPQYHEFNRYEVKGPFNGISVMSPDKNMGYALGVIGAQKLRFGGPMTSSPSAWANMASRLPAAERSQPGTAMAIDFNLAARESKVIRIVLAWYAPHWQGGTYKEITGFDGPWPLGQYQPAIRKAPGASYTAMYASRFADAVDVANRLARDHESLLARVLAWQQAIYSAKELPIWLQDCLVNNLNLVAEDSYWAQSMDMLGPWSKKMGVFGLNECPRSCSIIGCIASNFYGDHPILYFFPELERTELLAYRDTMRPDGAVPFLYPTGDWTRPNYEWQNGLNGACFVDLIDRLWMRTGDDGVLKELYPAVKKTTIFTMNLRPDSEDKGIISVPRDGTGQEWWEHTPLFGMTTHFGGVHLAQLKMAERMAKKMGDNEFEKQCQAWFDQGSKLMEEKLWNGDNYLLYFDPKTGKKDDIIMSSQLDGDWMAYFHGLPPVFPDNRALPTLATIKQYCEKPLGLAGFAYKDPGKEAGGYGSFLAEIHMVGMTYLYRGQRDYGISLAHTIMDDIARKQRHAFDLPNMIFIDTGERFFGCDYYQEMMLWAWPAAMQGKDLAAPCKPGGLVDRIIKAGSRS